MKVTTEKYFTITLTEHEALQLSDALYTAVSNKSLWTPTEAAIDLCESIINAIGKLDV